MGYGWFAVVFLLATLSILFPINISRRNRTKLQFAKLAERLAFPWKSDTNPNFAQISTEGFLFPDLPEGMQQKAIKVSISIPHQTRSHTPTWTISLSDLSLSFRDCEFFFTFLPILPEYSPRHIELWEEIWRLWIELQGAACRYPWEGEFLFQKAVPLGQEAALERVIRDHCKLLALLALPQIAEDTREMCKTLLKKTSDPAHFALYLKAIHYFFQRDEDREWCKDELLLRIVHSQPLNTRLYYVSLLSKCDFDFPTPMAQKMAISKIFANDEPRTIFSTQEHTFLEIFRKFKWGWWGLSSSEDPLLDPLATLRQSPTPPIQDATDSPHEANAYLSIVFQEEEVRAPIYAWLLQNKHRPFSSRKEYLYTLQWMSCAFLYQRYPLSFPSSGDEDNKYRPLLAAQLHQEMQTLVDSWSEKIPEDWLFCVSWGVWALGKNRHQEALPLLKRILEQWRPFALQGHLDKKPVQECLEHLCYAFGHCGDHKLLPTLETLQQQRWARPQHKRLIRNAMARIRQHIDPQTAGGLTLAEEKTSSPGQLSIPTQPGGLSRVYTKPSGLS